MSSCCNNNCCDSSGVTVVSTTLSVKDYIGACKVRWGIGRYNYKVEPGLYAIGKPDASSHVLVSANYKLTFDTLRKNLSALDCWLLILDTNGINVWCAAGKGTFGTDELVGKIEETGLKDIVEHRRLIVPQLGATGVYAHEVAKKTGFSVVYGPVRANDIKGFIGSNCKATKDMRTVNFSFFDRLVLTPIELVEAVKFSLVIFGIMFLMNLFAVRTFGILDFIIYFAGIIAGSVLTPLLLPIIPGRALAFKGWLLGAICIAFIAYSFGWFTQPHLLLGIGYTLVLPAYSSFLAMNFTGATTYTSYSGVMKEMKFALPAIIFSFIAGVVLILIKTFIG